MCARKVILASFLFCFNRYRFMRNCINRWLYTDRLYKMILKETIPFTTYLISESYFIKLRY